MDLLFKKISKINDLNFDKPVIVSGYVTNLRTDCFVLSNENNSIRCTMPSDMEILQDDILEVEGMLTFDLEDGYCISSKIIYKTDNHDIIKKSLKVYKKIARNLETEKTKKVINVFINRPFPKYVYNIGLIAATDAALQSFKIIFQEKCKGTLRIVKLDPKSLSTSEYLAFFNKYHNIDLIILLTTGLTFNQILKISCAENIKYMINRKNHPYIMSITDNVDEPVLTDHITNSKVNTIAEACDIISSSQKSISSKIDLAMDLVKNKMRGCLDQLRHEYNYYKMTECDIFADCNVQIVNNKIITLKSLLIAKLRLVNNMILDHHNKILLDIVDDERVQHIIDTLVRSEDKIHPIQSTLNRRSLSDDQINFDIEATWLTNYTKN